MVPDSTPSPSGFVGPGPAQQRCRHFGPGSASVTGGGQNGCTETEPWGDNLNPAATGIFRVGFLNHGGFSVEAAKGKSKEQKLYNHLIKYKFSSMGLAENNVHWNSVPADERLEDRTRGWFEQLARNTTYFKDCPIKTPHQWGSCDLWSINKAAYHIASHGSDPSSLGRWTWTHYRGKMANMSG